MAVDFTKDFNEGLSAVHEGRLSQYDDTKLNAFLNAAQRWEASGNPISQTGLVINAVRHELNHRQKDRHYNDSITEINRLHKEQLDEGKRMFSESSADSDKKHAQSSAIAKDANKLSRIAIWV